MSQPIIVRCPTCGSFAHRSLRTSAVSQASSATPSNLPNVMQTECAHCDYLMTICIDQNTICGVYAPAIAPRSQKHPIR